MQWLDAAKKLQVGQTQRVHCPACNKKDANIYNQGTKGYNIYCHRCGPVGYSPAGVLTVQEIAALKEAQRAAEQVRKSTTLVLPNDATYDLTQWSHTARCWLFKAGIHDVEAAQMAYSPKLQRVLLPVLDDNVLVYYQLRGFNTAYAKYVNPAIDASNIIYKRTHPTDKSVIVVCEDILSAYRVGGVVSACSILGTKASTFQLQYLSTFDKVIVWLDPDQAGITGTHKLTQALQLVTDVSTIVSTKDPKFYSNQEILEYVTNRPTPK